MTTESQYASTAPELEPCSPQMAIIRKEYGYGGIYSIGITKEGKLVQSLNPNEYQPGSGTRVIELPKVEGALSAPVKLFYDPSKICQLKCPFCLSEVPTDKDNRIKPARLTYKQVKWVNQEIINSGILQVKIGGGEPFINPFFWETVKDLGEAGISLSTSTSGITLADRRLLSDKKIELLRNSGLKISISVDGEYAFHDNIRGKEGLLKSALEGHKRLIEMGYDPKKIEFRATLTHDEVSLSQLDFLNKLSIEFNTRMRIRIVKPSGSAIANECAVIFPDALYWNFFDKIRDTANANKLLDVDDIFTFDQPTDAKSALDCGAGTRSAFIDAFGHFLPCGFIDQHFPVPHHELFSENRTLVDLWQNGEAFKQTRAYIKHENETNSCKDCGEVHACQGGCPSVRLIAQTELDPRCPKERKVFIPIESITEGGKELQYGHVTTGSILTYYSQEDEKKYLVLVGDNENGVLILGTPGGKMNSSVDKNVRQTSLREIEEETGLKESDLMKVDVTSPIYLANDAQDHHPDISEVAGDDLPNAIIVNNPKDKKHSPSVICVYKYETKILPVPMPDNAVVVLLPLEHKDLLSKPLTFEELKKVANVQISEKSKVPIKVIPVGTAKAIGIGQLS